MTILHAERARRLQRSLATARMGEPEKFRARAWLWMTRSTGELAGCSIHREWTILAVLACPARAVDLEAPPREPTPALSLPRKSWSASPPPSPIDLRQHLCKVVDWSVEVLPGVRGGGDRLCWTLGLDCGHTTTRIGYGREVTGLDGGRYAFPPPLSDGRRFSWRPTKASCPTCTGKRAGPTASEVRPRAAMRG